MSDIDQPSSFAKADFNWPSWKSSGIKRAAGSISRQGKRPRATASVNHRPQRGLGPAHLQPTPITSINKCAPSSSHIITSRRPSAIWCPIEQTGRLTDSAALPIVRRPPQVVIVDEFGARSRRRLPIVLVPREQPLQTLDFAVAHHLRRDWPAQHQHHWPSSAINTSESSCACQSTSLSGSGG